MDWMIRLKTEEQAPRTIILIQTPCRGVFAVRPDKSELIETRFHAGVAFTTIISSESTIKDSIGGTLTKEAVGEGWHLSIGPVSWLLSPGEAAVVARGLCGVCVVCDTHNTATSQCARCDGLGCDEHVFVVDHETLCARCLYRDISEARVSEEQAREWAQAKREYASRVHDYRHGVRDWTDLIH